MKFADTGELCVCVSWGWEWAGDDAGFTRLSHCGDECVEVLLEIYCLFDDVVGPDVDDDGGGVRVF